MNQSTRAFINNLAEAVIDAYDIEIPITDIESVVNKIGGTVLEKPEFNYFYDGSIMKRGKDSFSIAISPNQSTQRKAFTIAHELGHLFLHMGYRTDNETWNNQDQSVFTRFGRSEQEYQANEFAASLLMPKDDYLKFIRENAKDNTIDMRSVAMHFHVSVPAAVNRGKFLGCL